MKTSINESLPTEILISVFSHITAVPFYDEFSEDVEAYIRLDCDPKTPTRAIAHDQEAEIIQARLRIVLTCKRWHDIGLRTLWSHLRIGSSFSLASILHIIDYIGKNPQHAVFVRRLTVLPMWFPSIDSQDEEDRSNLIQNLVTCLPSLKIIFCPWSCIPDEYPSAVTVANLEARGYMTAHVPLHETTVFFHNLRILTIDFGPDSIFDPFRHTTFPVLENLRVRCDKATAPSYIAHFWSLPKLKSFSLQSHFIGHWSTLLRKWGDKLEKLELITRLSPSIRPLTFPELSCLYIGHPPYLPWRRLITAPKLTRLGLFGIDPGHDMRVYQTLPNIINDFVAKFETVKELCIYGRQTRPLFSLQGWEGLHMEDVEGWRDKGIQVMLRPDKTWRFGCRLNQA